MYETHLKIGIRDSLIFRHARHPDSNVILELRSACAARRWAYAESHVEPFGACGKAKGKLEPITFITDLLANSAMGDEQRPEIALLKEVH